MISPAGASGMRLQARDHDRTAGTDGLDADRARRVVDVEDDERVLGRHARADGHRPRRRHEAVFCPRDGAEHDRRRRLAVDDLRERPLDHDRRLRQRAEHRRVTAFAETRDLPRIERHDLAGGHDDRIECVGGRTEEHHVDRDVVAGRVEEAVALVDPAPLLAAGEPPLVPQRRRAERHREPQPASRREVLEAADDQLPSRRLDLDRQHLLTLGALARHPEIDDLHAVTLDRVALVPRRCA